MALSLAGKADPVRKRKAARMSGKKRTPKMRGARKSSYRGKRA